MSKAESDHLTTEINEKKKIVLNDENSDDTPTPPRDKNVVKELNPFEIRWYHKDAKKVWMPFGGRDSLLIEMKYRLHNDEHLGDDFPDKEKAIKMCNATVVVLDGYQELVLKNKKATIRPIYWEGKSTEIIRGRWFLENDWIPFEKEEADKIEEEHLKQFRGKELTVNLTLIRKDQKKVLHALALKNFGKIEWYATNYVALISNRPWAHYIKLRSNFTKLRRGFHTFATLLNGPLPVKYLIFIVHGAGEKIKMSDVVHRAKEMRNCANHLLKQSFFGVKYRPMYLPVDWRSDLKLDEGLVDAITPAEMELIRSLCNSTVMDLMYYTSPKFRSEVSDGLVTVLNKLYEKFLEHNTQFEAIYGEISVVAHSLGAVMCYDTITGWSPLQQYDDFITERMEYVMQSPFVSDESKKQLKILENARKELYNIEGNLLHLLTLAEANTMQLSFHLSIQNLFMFGSPLGVFLALRGQTGTKVHDHKTPLLFNIFHPSDPVAYRLEPLVHKLYAYVRPVRIQKHEAKDIVPYSEMPMEMISKHSARKLSKKEKSTRENMDEEKTVGEQQEKNAKTAIANVQQSPEFLPSSIKSQVAIGGWGFAQYFRQDTGESKPVASKPIDKQTGLLASDNSSSQKRHFDLDVLIRIPHENKLPYRFDYVMKETRLDYAFLSPLLSHAYYWSDMDVNMFILMQIYRLNDAEKTSEEPS